MTWSGLPTSESIREPSFANWQKGSPMGDLEDIFQRLNAHSKKLQDAALGWKFEETKSLGFEKDAWPGRGIHAEIHTEPLFSFRVCSKIEQAYSKTLFQQQLPDWF